MFKRIAVLTLSLILALMPMSALAEEWNPADFLDWYTESNLWKTVENGHFSSDPADQITDEELERVFKFAVLQQNGVQWMPYYFVVVKDVEEQIKLLGDAFDAGTIMASEGTVTVLVMADQILLQEEGHATPYEGYYIPSTWPYYDSGMTSAMMQLAANMLGYQTHYIGAINGEYAPYDLADGKYQSMSRYIKPEYTRVWGFPNNMGEEYDPASIFPVAGNCVFVCAIVVGKANPEETVETWGTNHARPDNWVIWDGVPNEEPSPAIAAYEAIKAAEAGEEDIELGENEYLGIGQGNNGKIKVKVTVEDGTIANVEIVEHSETSGVADEAINNLPGMIVEAQSADVDSISGCTVASEAIKNAVKDALKQAGL